MLGKVGEIYSRFNPRTYIRYDYIWKFNRPFFRSFNPRTYIRYDL